MVLPDGFTFAEYARRGFFELLAVTVINIVLMLICSTVFRESKILRFILTGITVCTYIMIVSATYRMLLYISAYNLTFLRLFVLLFLLIDAIVLAGVIISEYRKEFPLFRYSVAAIVACYLIFSFAKPDYYIASYHINNKGNLNSEDIIYLTEELSSDAAPAVVPLLSDPESLNAKIKGIKGNDYENFISSDFLSAQTSRYYDRIKSKNTNRGIRDFNYSYYQAFKYTKLNPVN
jgi:hypothetical protein